MTELSPRERHRIAPLFDHTEETMVRSCLDGMMGRAWADRADTPACAQIVTADFCFFAGDASAPGASALVRNIPPRIPNDLLILAAPDEGWERLIGDAYPDAARGERYALKKEPDCFDRARLLAYAQGLGPDIQGSDVRFHGSIFLFAHGQAAHHAAQRHTGRAHQR